MIASALAHGSENNVILRLLLFIGQRLKTRGWLVSNAGGTVYWHGVNAPDTDRHC